MMNRNNGKTKVLLRTAAGYTVKTLDEIGKGDHHAGHRCCFYVNSELFK